MVFGIIQVRAKLRVCRSGFGWPTKSSRSGGWRP